MWPMVFLLPFWITFGRSYFGSGGWLAFVSLFTTIPMLVVALIVINIIIHFNATYKLERLVTKPQAIVLALLYWCIFLYGIFIVDGGDTVESLGSVATRIFGKGFMNISTELGVFFYIASFILLLAAFIVALGGRFTWVRSWKVWTVIGVILFIGIGTTVGLNIRHDNDPKVKDEQISYDFHLMKQDIQSYARENDDVLPSGDAMKIAEIGEYGQEFEIAKRAGAYTYIPLQVQRQFQLCATFETDNMADYPGGELDESYHHAGYQCFTYDLLIFQKLK